MDNQELSFVELNQSKVTDDVIQQFDCGNEDMTEYLHKYAKNDSIEGKGVTYVLENIFMLMQLLRHIAYTIMMRQRNIIQR